MHGLAQWAGEMLVSGVWQGFVLAVAVGLCLRMVPRTTASLRFAIWTMVFLLVLALPFLEGMRHEAASSVTGASVLRLDERWGMAIAALWAGLSFVRAMDLVMHAVQLRRMRLRSVPVAVEAEDVLPRKVQVCTSDDVDRPSVIGFLSPRILIPTWLMEQLSQEELTQIVLHESEHLRRGDDWINLLQKVSLVLFPLNPVLMWIERRLCFERELACDDGVLRRTGAPKAYATCLTNLAERRLYRRSALSLALGAIERQSELARRVHRILLRPGRLTPIQTKALSGAVALGLVVGATGLAHCPQMVSFAPVTQPMQATKPMGVEAPLYGAPVMQNVRYAESEMPHATLLKASVPEKRAVQGLAVAPKKIAKVQRKRVKPMVVPVAQRQAGVDRRPSTQGWVVLTSWSEGERPAMIVPVVQDQQGLPSYAAVPTANGWLIVQL